MLRDMQGQTSRLINLVDDLLMVSKAESGTIEIHPQSFDIVALVRKVVRDIQAITTTHRIILKPCKKTSVHADKSRITQVIINLISNAAKYSPQGNKVYITVTTLGKKCTVSIRDFGSGISLKDQRQLFTRFFRSSTDARTVAGTGLGLYIAKEIIRKHRQKIWVKSEVGKGTTFSFTLSVVV
jgi:signal transduction histidine kinase